MDIGVDIWFTLALAACALVLGRFLVLRVNWLARYSIPEAVVGGILFAAVITALRMGAGVQVNFDTTLLTPLNVMFFTTVGLSADARALMKGGRMLALFLVVVSGSLLLENGIGYALARLFDLHPANGLVTGSIALAGGHGTAAAWGSKFVEERNIQGVVELGIAAATYGLVVGGVLGGPFASWLMRRHQIHGTAHATPSDGPTPDTAQTDTTDQPLAMSTLIETLLLVFVSMAVGFTLYQSFGQDAFTLPSFIWALVVGVVLRNLFSLTGLYRMSDQALDTIGTLSLSLFLAMIIMTLKLWELVDLAGPVLVILVTQSVALLAWCAFVTFRVMGRNYDAVLLATGQLGFGLGSTATAMVNVQAVTHRHGHSPLAFLLIPVMGAFLIDLVNALTIQGFLMLPAFNW
ncbi:MAG: sodium/glutamate symporter [Lautropia sp.]|nr:sodium/glutamate symporter [Lautropia sp.]